VEVRGFVESDRADLLAVFARAGEGAPGSPPWGHAPSEADVWLTPYIDRVPGSVFVAVADDAIVGYLAGCPDPSSIPSESERIRAAFRRHRLYLRPRAVAYFARALGDAADARLHRRPTAQELVDPAWPAHLHIDLAPEARGTGLGPALMGRWQDQLRDIGSPGCYLQTLVENTRAVRFFERAGFRRHGPTPVVPGARHRGSRVHQQTMVWEP
jgi:ribosomal protein S18 acetylase RimI-like enzyme